MTVFLLGMLCGSIGTIFVLFLISCLVVGKD